MKWKRHWDDSWILDDLASAYSVSWFCPLLCGLTWCQRCCFFIAVLRLLFTILSVSRKLLFVHFRLLSMGNFPHLTKQLNEFQKLRTMWMCVYVSKIGQIEVAIRQWILNIRHSKSHTHTENVKIVGTTIDTPYTLMWSCGIEFDTISSNFQKWQTYAIIIRFEWFAPLQAWTQMHEMRMIITPYTHTVCHDLVAPSLLVSLLVIKPKWKICVHICICFGCNLSIYLWFKFYFCSILFQFLHSAMPIVVVVSGMELSVSHVVY